MTFPGGDSGDKPRDQTGEGVSSASEDAPRQASDEAPPVEHLPPPAYEHPPGQVPPAQAAYGTPNTPPLYPPPGGYGPYPSPSGANYPPPGYPDPAAGGPPPPPPPPQYGAPVPHYGSPYPGGGYPAPDPYGYGPGQPQQTKTNTMAIASLVISVLGIVPFCGGILSIVGIVLGTVALSQIKETRQEGYGLAIAGIVVGVAMLIVGLIWTIFALR